MADYTVLVLVALLGFYVYVVVPLCVGRKLTWPTSPDIFVLSADDPRLPNWAKHFFDDVSLRLATIGFQPATYLLTLDWPPGATGCLAIFVRPGEPDTAAAEIVKCEVPTRPASYSHQVEFVGDFLDGIQACTSNTRVLPWAISDRRKLIRRFPKMADLGLLYRIHKELTKNVSREVENPVRQPADFAQDLRGDLARFCENAVQAGYMYLAADGRAYRYTIKGRLLALNKQLPPISTIRRWLVKRTARRLLRELGLPTTYATVDYAAQTVPTARTIKPPQRT